MKAYKILVISLLFSLFFTTAILAQGPKTNNDPPPPWQGQVLTATPLYQFRGGKLVKTGDIISPGQVGINGFGGQWVNISIHGHFIKMSAVSKIWKNSEYPYFQADPEPIYSKKTVRKCDIFGLYQGKLVPVGSVPANTEIGIYSQGDGWTQNSPWIQWVKTGECFAKNYIKIDLSNFGKKTFSWGSIDRKNPPPPGAMAVAIAPATLVDTPFPGPADVIVVVAGASYYGWYVTRDIDWGTLVPVDDLKNWAQIVATTRATNWNGSAWMSTRHPESSMLIKRAYGISQGVQGGLLRQRGNCQEGRFTAGEICIFAALNPGQTEGHIAILMEYSEYAAFMVISGQVRSTPPGVQESSKWTRLGTTQYYMKKSSMFWSCAWWMANRTNPNLSNGHIEIPPKYRMDFGTGWGRWQEIKTRYGLVFPIARIPLPLP